jgi:hypothetical protein
VTGAAVVYSLCLLTSVACAALLVRSWLASRTRLLLFSAVCFALLAVNNLLVVVDMVLLPVAPDLTLWRQIAALAALGVLLYGFRWETE